MSVAVVSHRLFRSFASFTKFICLVLLLVSPMTSFSQSEAEPGSFHRFWPDNMFAVEFASQQVGFIAGYSGTFLRTTDGGKNWEGLYIGRNELIRRISFVDENTGWAVGHRGSIFHTQDAGQTWEVQKELPGIYLRDIDFFDKDHGWVVGHNTSIWHTRDGGKSWEQQELLGFTGRDKPRLHGIYAKDAQNAILVGEFGTIAHTENGGDVWLKTPYQSTTTWLSIAGNGETIYAVGLDGNIVRLNLATEEQRAEMALKHAKSVAKKEKRARAKAKRLNREYVPPPEINLPESEIEYSPVVVESNTKEHLFDIAVTAKGEAIVVGRSTMLKLADTTATMLTAETGFPLPYVWLGGVAVTAEGMIWAAGIRGLVASGNLQEMTFGQSFNLAAPGSVKLISSRWDKK